MQDILITIIVAWILFRLFRPVVIVHSNKQHRHYHNYSPGSPNQPADGEINITRKPQQNTKRDSSDEGGEYIDYEELPK